MASSTGNTSSGDIEMTTFQNLMQDVSKSTECPVCMDIPIPPILLCLSGHIICSYCRPRLETCGLCHMDFTEIRNYSMESVVAHFDVDCRNDRCEKKVKADELRAHMEVCEYREVNCYDNRLVACSGRKWPFDGYVDHLRVAHRYFPIMLQDNGRPINSTMALDPRTGVTWKPCIMMYKEQGFILKASSFGNGAITLWLAALLSEQNASKYRCVIQLERGGNEEEEDSNVLMVSTITAHSIHAEVKADGQGASNGLIIPELDTVSIPNDGLQLTAGRNSEKQYWNLKCCMEEVENEDAGTGTDVDENASPPLRNWAVEVKLEKIRVNPNGARRLSAQGQGQDVENRGDQGNGNGTPRAEGGQGVPGRSISSSSFSKDMLCDCFRRYCPNIIFVSLVGVCVSFIYWFLLGGIVFDK